jgi:hypothetical protein
MNLDEALKVSAVERKLDGNKKGMDAKARRFSKTLRIILAYSTKYIYIETYSGPSRRIHELKRINKRTILYSTEVLGKEDWEPI